MFVRIHEDDDHGKLSSSVYKVARLNPVPSEKPSDRMDRSCGVHIFLPQVVEDLHVQRPVMPLVGFVKIDCDLNSHRVWHFTVPAPEPYRPPLRRGTINCW